MNGENWLLEVVEAMPDGVVIVDREGTMMLVNRELERLSDWDRSELLGHKIEMLLPDSMTELHRRHRADFNANPHRRSMGQGFDLVTRRRDGTTLPVEVSLAPAVLQGDHVVIASVRDVRSNREAEAALNDARERVLLAEDHERIARDLHDTVIQRLFASGLTLQSVVNTVPVEARAKIERIIDDQDDAIRELRTAIFGLASKRSAGRTVRVVVNDIVDESARVLGFRPTLHFFGVLDTVDEVTAAEVAAVAREALSNVARHARANKVDVTLAHRDGALSLTVVDDGEGIPSSHRLGSGLLNMHDRAERLGGNCNVISEAHHGTTVKWSVPTSE